jgi:hypothetical protein
MHLAMFGKMPRGRRSEGSGDGPIVRADPD